MWSSEHRIKPVYFTQATSVVVQKDIKRQKFERRRITRRQIYRLIDWFRSRSINVNRFSHLQGLPEFVAYNFLDEVMIVTAGTLSPL